MELNRMVFECILEIENIENKLKFVFKKGDYLIKIEKVFDHQGILSGYLHETIVCA